MEINRAVEILKMSKHIKKTLIDGLGWRDHPEKLLTESCVSEVQAWLNSQAKPIEAKQRSMLEKVKRYNGAMEREREAVRVAEATRTGPRRDQAFYSAGLSAAISTLYAVDKRWLCQCGTKKE
jgi:hypothetical protein